MKKISFFILLAVLLTSCVQKQNYILHEKHYRSTKPSYVEKHHFYFLGVGQEKIVDRPGEYCRENQIVSKVVTRATPMDFFLTFITVSIYSPRTVEIYCLKTRKHH